MIGATKQVPIKDDKKRRHWHFKLSTKEEKMMKGYALSLKRQKQNDLHNQTSENQRRRWHFKLKSAKKKRRQ